MRLAFVIADPGVPIGGRKGAAIHVHDLARAFGNAGVEVVALASRVEQGIEGVEVREVRLDPDVEEVIRQLHARPEGDRTPPIAPELAALLRDQTFEQALAKAHAEAPFDALYERQSLFGLAGLRFARRAGIPFGLEVNAPLPEEQARWRGLSLESLALAIEKRLLREADAVFCVSSFLRERAVRLGADPGRAHLLPNGVDPSLFHPGVSGAPVREKLGLGQDFVLGFFGTLRPWHGVEFLVESFARFLRRVPSSRLLVVGDGPARARAEEAANRALPEGAARFLGWIPREEVPAHVAACDVVASPHPPIEPFYFSPLKIFEAMALGRVVLAPDLPAFREIARDGATAALYRPADGEDFVRRLLALRDSPEERRAIGERASREVLSRRTWVQNARAVLESFEAVREAVP